MADLENLLAEIDVSETFAPISAAIRALTRVIDESHFTLAGQLQSIHNACLELLERSKPKSPCIFCSLTENLDSHSTMRCNRFPDPVSKALQAARLQLCERCLKAQHDGEDCGVKCTMCGLPHNTLLCHNRARPEVQPFKRRRF
ncbi:hypothetical protein Y032_0063g3445 [Ancylostoma ceylanicum]|uniref:Uncharacterized protein n=1 Tax=Ancylostoma ceylanicum TaxID=53326 RepID=A0A016U1G7_9BILA|nr:hypothetical protein Y032_0063g3445 [Ancylostoma ceylanicum]